MIKHKTSVIESFATELTSEPRFAVLLSDVLLHCASFYLLGAVRTRQLFCVTVHPLSVIVEATGKFERHATLKWLILILDIAFGLIIFAIFLVII